MNKDQFYNDSDSPSPTARGRMWNNIMTETRVPSSFLSIGDRKSFLYGMAASLILLLSIAGLSSIVEKSVHAGQPAEIQFDDAYRSAIAEFEEVLPAITSSSLSGSMTELLRAKERQLALIDAAINELRSDLLRHDLSPVKQARLRRLYSMKLLVLQELIEQGELRS